MFEHRGYKGNTVEHCQMDDTLNTLWTKANIVDDKCFVDEGHIVWEVHVECWYCHWGLKWTFSGSNAHRGLHEFTKLGKYICSA